MDNFGGSFKAFSHTLAEGVVHVSNSQYGVEYLEERGIELAKLLPDYIHTECADAVDPFSTASGQRGEQNCQREGQDY